MSWIWSALMPHPPVLIPEVGRGREHEASKTLQGISELTSLLKDRKPDTILLLSPHQPYADGALFVNSSGSYQGSFALFGVPGVRVSASSSGQAMKDLCAYLEGLGIRTFSRPLQDLTEDQGSLVPLYFLAKVWGGLPEVIITSPIGLGVQEAFRAGQVLRDFKSTKKLALLASGDMSHRLTPDAPAGYEPEYAPVFESAIEEALSENSPDPVLRLSARTLGRAGECGLRSLMIMLGLAGAKGKIEILSHEWPFGVGYCNALWLAEESKEVPEPARLERDTARELEPANSARSSDHQPGSTGLARNTHHRSGNSHPTQDTDTQPAAVTLARETVTRLLNNKPLPKTGNEIAHSELWRERKACFVSIKTLAGELRGCIGTLSPLKPSLDLEIIANAVSASTRDPRFPPMTAHELDNVTFSVDILSEPEGISGLGQLNPKIYGVIVSKGYNHGVLLPDLEGIDTPEQQVEIAALKAGIYDIEGVRLERFTVERHKERV